MAKATFNGITRIISIKDNVTDIDIGIDVYSEWKRWALVEFNGRYESAFRSIGGDQITDSSKLGASYFLQNGWKIRPFEGDHTLRVNGNIYCEDSSSPFIHTIGNYNVQVISTVSAIVETEIVEVNTGGSNNQLIKNIIYLDENSVYSGTNYPYGSYEYPSNNITDAINIAKNNGIDTIKIMSSMTISNKTIDNINIIGSPSVILTLDRVSITNVVFSLITIKGTISGHFVCKQCNLSNLNIDTCEIISSMINDSFFIHGHSVVATNCFSRADTELKILSEGQDLSLLLTNFNGNIELYNSSSNQVFSFNFISGSLSLDTTCNGGDVYVSGMASILNNSSLSISTDSISTPKNIAEKIISYDINNITDNDGITLGGFIKYKLLSTLRFLGLK